MPFRIRFLFALLLAFAAFVPAEQKVISGNFDLNALSTYLPTTLARSDTILIDNYVKPGQLKIDQSDHLDTLRLQRLSSDSDGVINVDSTFIDARNFAGTLILKNLAFRLTKPKSVLISSFDPNQPNHNLILDSCYIYADTLDAAFLGWQGDTLSKVDIRNSWFVAAASRTGTASMQISTGSATLSNCLLNFAGTFTAPSITNKFEAYSNTINRVQFRLTGNISGGTAPSYNFSQNLVAYHGPVNAFGGTNFYVLNALGFNDNRSSIQTNRIYSVWNGFDAPAGDLGKNGVKIDSTYDKPTTELWDWYTNARDSSTGMLSGNTTLRRFNVLPGKVSVDTVIGGDTVRVSFKSATYPRAFRWNVGAPPPLQDSAFRVRAILPGRLSFGPFQVDNIRDNAVAIYGTPLLLVQSPAGPFLPQPSASLYNQGPSLFQNRSPTARVFALVDSGNTPHGPSIEPVLSSAAKFEHLRFAKVIDAGQTISISPKNDQIQMPDSLRFLKRNFGFSTSATVNTAVTFASSPNTQPWARPSDGALYWYWKSKDTLIPAVPGTIWGDSLLYGSFHYANADSIFIAYLVEKLSAHADPDFHIAVPGAMVISNSKAGYQLYVDTSSIDAGLYASATKGYRFTWNGRGAGDSLFLLLHSPSRDAQVFVKVPSKPEADTLHWAADSAGNFRIPIDTADTGKIFFAGVKYNVLAANLFNGVVDSVRVTGLYSITPGHLAFRNVLRSDVLNLGSNSDSVFQNTHFLGGIQDVSSGLTITRDDSLTFGVIRPLPSDSAETWALEGGRWIKLARSMVSGDSVRILVSLGNNAAPTHFIVLERFNPPENYVKPTVLPNKDSLVVFLDSIMPGNPIAGYCVSIRTIDTLGNIKDGDCKVLPLDTVFRQAIDASLGYAYRVDYIMGSGTDTARLVRDFQYPDNAGWDAKKVFASSNAEAKTSRDSRWRLVAMPVAAPLSRLLQHGKRTSDTTTGIDDRTLVLDLKTDQKTTQFDTLPNAKTPFSAIQVNPTKGILIASSHSISFTLDSLGAAVQSAKPETLTVDSGWHLIGNPFPIRLRKECVTSSVPHVIHLRSLSYDPQTKNYSWPEVPSALASFTGYAYFTPFHEVLKFDPACPMAAPKVAANAGASTRIKVNIQAAFGTSDMSLVRSPGEYAIGFLPAPAAGLELRVGGGEGYWIKPVADPDRIDQPVEIRSAQAGIAAFTLAGGSAAPAFALIDLATGQVYDAAASRALPLRAGTQTYRLFAGDPAFVAAGTRSFRAAAPAQISLSQNFPNPARGLTRIAVDWPGTTAQDRKAYLEVIDLQGRRVATQRVDAIHVGRQVLVLDAQDWKPGLYIYRLVVSAGGHVARFQKRMLVAP